MIKSQYPKNITKQQAVEIKNLISQTIRLMENKNKPNNDLKKPNYFGLCKKCREG